MASFLSPKKPDILSEMILEAVSPQVGAQTCKDAVPTHATEHPTRRSLGKGISRIEYQIKWNGKLYNANWDVEPFGDSTMAHLEISIPRIKQVFAIVAGSLLIAAPVAVWAWLHFTHSPADLAGGLSKAAPAFLMLAVWIVSGLSYMKFVISHLNQIKRLTFSTVAAIQSAKLRPLSSVASERGVFGKKGGFSLLLLSFALVAAACLWMGPVVPSVLVIITLLMLFSTYIARRAYRRDVYIQHKINIVSKCQSWVAVNYMILFFLFAFQSLVPNLFLIGTGDISPGQQSAGDSIREWLSASPRQADKFFGVAPRDKLEAMKKLAALQAERAGYKNPTEKQLSQAYKVNVGLLAIIGAFALCMGIFLVGAACWQIMTIPNDLRTAGVAVRGRGLAPSPTPREFTRKRLFYGLYIIGSFLIMAVWNVLGTLVGIDALSYLITGQSLLFQWTHSLFSWIGAVFLAIGETFGLSEGWVAGPNIVVLLIISVTLTPLLLSRIAIGILTLVRLLARTVRKPHHKPPEPVMSFISTICHTYNITTPRVHVIHSEHIIIEAHPKLLGLQVLVVSNGALQNLDSDALTAAVAHELGHFKRGTRKLCLLRLLSWLTMSPNAVLELLVDFVELEYEADAFAVQTTNNPSALIRAITIIKSEPQFAALADVMELASGDQADKRISSWLSRKGRGLRILYLFLFGYGLLGYTHPTWEDRIEAITKLAGQTGSNHTQPS